MRPRRFTLLVLVYVTLDLANPIMPGAVQLVGPSLEAVAGCHCRTGEVAAPAVPLGLRHLSTIDSPPDPPVRLAPRRAAISPPAPPRTPPEPGRPSTAPSDDD